jgi:predicted AAA+ superfamily ATPase
MRNYAQHPQFSYWRSGPKGEEVDLIAELPDRAVPFEVKYQDTEIDGQKLKGLRLSWKSTRPSRLMSSRSGRKIFGTWN